jgi:hypothetical protein
MQGKPTFKPTLDNKPNFFKRLFNYIHNFFFPTSTENKKLRYSQLKNFSIFLVSSLLFFYFEDNISKVVALETSEIHRGMHPGGPGF